MTFKRFALWSDSSGAIVGLLNCCLSAPLKGVAPTALIYRLAVFVVINASAARV